MKVVDETYDKKKVRGVTIRYWDDVKEGDMITPVQRPAHLADIQGYASAAIRRWLTGNSSDISANIPPTAFIIPLSNRAGAVSRINTDDYVCPGTGHPFVLRLRRRPHYLDRTCPANWMGDDGFLEETQCGNPPIGTLSAMPPSAKG